MPHKLGDYPIIPLESTAVLLPSPTDHFLDLTGQDPFAKLDASGSSSVVGLGITLPVSDSTTSQGSVGSGTTVTSPVEMEPGEELPSLTTSISSTASTSTTPTGPGRTSPWTLPMSSSTVHKASSYSHLLRTAASPNSPPSSSSITPSIIPTSPTRGTYAYQKPAFRPRPSLPSLHALASMNMPVPNKVRKGRVGATLPAEPWDTLTPDTLSPQSSRAHSPAPGFVSRYGYGMDSDPHPSSSTSTAKTSSASSSPASPAPAVALASNTMMSIITSPPPKTGDISSIPIPGTNQNSSGPVSPSLSPSPSHLSPASVPVPVPIPGSIPMAAGSISPTSIAITSLPPIVPIPISITATTGSTTPERESAITPMDMDTPSLEYSSSSLSTSPESSSEGGYGYGYGYGYGFGLVHGSWGAEDTSGSSTSAEVEVEMEMGDLSSRVQVGGEDDGYRVYSPSEDQRLEEEGLGLGLGRLPPWSEKDTHELGRDFQGKPLPPPPSSPPTSYPSLGVKHTSTSPPPQTSHHLGRDGYSQGSGGQGPPDDDTDDWNDVADSDVLRRAPSVEDEDAPSSTPPPQPTQPSILTLPTIQPLRIATTTTLTTTTTTTTTTTAAKQRGIADLPSPPLHKLRHYRSMGINFGRGGSRSGSRSGEESPGLESPGLEAPGLEVASSPIEVVEMDHAGASCAARGEYGHGHGEPYASSSSRAGSTHDHEGGCGGGGGSASVAEWNFGREAEVDQESVWDVGGEHDYHAHGPSPPPLSSTLDSLTLDSSTVDSLFLDSSTAGLLDDPISDPNDARLEDFDGINESWRSANLIVESTGHSHINTPEVEPICGWQGEQTSNSTAASSSSFTTTTTTTTSVSPSPSSPPLDASSMPLLAARGQYHQPRGHPTEVLGYGRSSEQRLGVPLSSRSHASSSRSRTTSSSRPPSDSEDEASSSSSSTSLSDKAASDSEEDDDVPLAQQIPTALRAQKTIRRQVREEKEKRRRERGAAKAALEGHPGHSAGHGHTSRNAPGAGFTAMSSSQEAAAAANALSSSLTATHLSPTSPPKSSSRSQSNSANSGHGLKTGMNAVPPPMNVMASTTNTTGSGNQGIDSRTVAPGHATSKPIARSATRVRTKTLPGNTNPPSQTENMGAVAGARMHPSSGQGQGQGQYGVQALHHQQQYQQQQYPHQQYSQSQGQQYPLAYSHPHPQHPGFAHPSEQLSAPAVESSAANGRRSTDEYNRKRSLSLHRNQHPHQPQPSIGVQLHDVPIPSPSPIAGPMTQSPPPHPSLSRAVSKSSRPHRSATMRDGHSHGTVTEDESAPARSGRALGRSNTTARARSRSRAPGGGGVSPLPHGLHPQSPINPDLLPPPPPIPGLGSSLDPTSSSSPAFDPRHSCVPTPASRAHEKALEKEKALERANAQYQYRVYMGDSESYNMVEVRPGTNAKDVVLGMQDAGMMKGWVGSGEWMLWEVWKDFGMERPIRTFEIVPDVVAAWDSGRTVNKLVAKISSMAPVLSRSALPSSAPAFSGYVDWEAKRGKWTKKYLMLRENGLYIAKRENAKEELLCSLSNFDTYIITRAIKAPKPFSFAVKSTDDLSFFEDKSDYMHVFSCEEKTGMKWVERILVARSFVLYQEKSTLFTTSNGAAPTGLSRSGTTRKRAPTISAASAPAPISMGGGANGPNMTVSHTAVGGGMQGTLLNMAPAAMFEPGSLLSKQRAMS